MVLPETITNVNPLDVAAPVPGDVPIDSTVPAGDVPIDVAPPGEATAPSLGNLPSDGSLDIAPPESLEATVPPIDNVPSPLEVAPPEGWVPEDDETIQPLSLESDLHYCAYYSGSLQSDKDKCKARVLEEYAAQIEADIKNSVGSDISEKEVQAMIQDLAQALSPGVAYYGEGIDQVGLAKC